MEVKDRGHYKFKFSNEEQDKIRDAIKVLQAMLHEAEKRNCNILRENWNDPHCKNGSTDSSTRELDNLIQDLWHLMFINELVRDEVIKC